MVTEEVVDNKEEVVNWSLGWFVLLNISGVNFFNSMCANLRVCKVYTLILQAKVKGASICRETNTFCTCIHGSSGMVGAGQVCLPQLSTIFSIIIHEFMCICILQCSLATIDWCIVDVGRAAYKIVSILGQFWDGPFWYSHFSLGHVCLISGVINTKKF